MTLKMKRSSSRHNGNGHAAEKPSSGFVALSLLMTPSMAPKPKPEDGPPCHLCTARCCKYFAVEIDAPTDREDHEYIRWFLMHEGIAVWMDEGDWYLEVRTVCRHLQPDNSCGIYEKRPQVCRDYGVKDKDPCEFFTDDLEYDLYFDSDEKFEAWYKDEQIKKEKARNKRALLKKRRDANQKKLVRSHEGQKK